MLIIATNLGLEEGRIFHEARSQYKQTCFWEATHATPHRTAPLRRKPGTRERRDSTHRFTRLKTLLDEGAAPRPAPSSLAERADTTPKHEEPRNSRSVTAEKRKVASGPGGKRVAAEAATVPSAPGATGNKYW